MSRNECFWHGDEPLHELHTTLCYECGHAFTTEELIAEDLRVRVELFWLSDTVRTVPTLRALDEIFICPLCSHDL